MALEHGDVSSKIFFIDRNEIYDTQKPYSLRYEAGGEIQHTNVVHHEHETKVCNMRNHLDSLSFGESGFRVLQLKSQMEYNDYADTEKIDSIHTPEIETELIRTFQASEVHVFDSVVRKEIPLLLCQ